MRKKQPTARERALTTEVEMLRLGKNNLEVSLKEMQAEQESACAKHLEEKRALIEHNEHTERELANLKGIVIVLSENNDRMTRASLRSQGMEWEEIERIMMGNRSSRGMSGSCSCPTCRPRNTDTFGRGY